MRSFFIVTSPSYGGAEKRFFDVFTALRRSGAPVGFIAPSCLLDRLSADYPDRADVLAAVTAVPLSTWRPFVFVWRLFRVVRGLPRGGNFHYPLLCLLPLHIGRGDKVSLSVVDSARIPRLLKSSRNMKWTWLMMQFASHIDVLNPSNFDAMRGYRIASRMSLTPGGTFLVPSRNDDAPKRPSVVFLGRLVPLKGLDDFLDVLPDLWLLIKTSVPLGFSFDFAGYGPLERHLVSRLDELRKLGVPVQFLGFVDATQVLSRSAVFVSMQECTNYPSRVVAEALVSGCGVVVRDTGDSRAFGSDVAGLHYCNAQLDAKQLAPVILDLLKQAMYQPAWRSMVRAQALSSYSSPAYVQYYAHLLGLEILG